jgi:hypothetical protein
MNYEWKEPSLRARGRNNKLVTRELLDLLQSNPGKWLSIGIQNRSSWARSIANHHKDQIELTARNIRGQQAEVFLRWIANEVQNA